MLWVGGHFSPGRVLGWAGFFLRMLSPGGDWAMGRQRVGPFDRWGGGSGFGVRIAIAHPLLKVLKVLKVLGPKTAIVKGKLAGSTGTVVQN